MPKLFYQYPASVKQHRLQLILFDHSAQRTALAYCSFLPDKIAEPCRPHPISQRFFLRLCKQTIHHPPPGSDKNTGSKGRLAIFCNNLTYDIRCHQQSCRRRNKYHASRNLACFSTLYRFFGINYSYTFFDTCRTQLFPYRPCQRQTEVPLMSSTARYVGSSLLPVPIEEMTGISRCTHSNKRSTFDGVESIASAIKVKLPEKTRQKRQVHKIY